jgi:hypothetical protein
MPRPDIHLVVTACTNPTSHRPATACEPRVVGRLRDILNAMERLAQLWTAWRSHDQFAVNAVYDCTFAARHRGNCGNAHVIVAVTLKEYLLRPRQVATGADFGRFAPTCDACSRAASVNVTPCVRMYALTRDSLPTIISESGKRALLAATTSKWREGARAETRLHT